MSCGRWDKEITPRLSLSFNLQARGAFCGHLEPCQAFAAIGPNPIGPLVSKTEANTNSLPAPLLFGHLKNQKRRIGCPAGPALRDAPCWTCSSDGATSEREAAPVGRPLPPGRGSLRSTSSQSTQWNGGHLRSRLHATTNVVCSSLPRPARHEALHESRLSTAVVHLICNQGVTGSNPVAGTNELNNLLASMHSAIFIEVTLR